MAKIDGKRVTEIRNRRAGFDFLFLDAFESGIMLTGTEIKSVRDGKVNLTDAFCFFKDNELFVKNLHIAIYEMGSYNNHDPMRERKLLLNKREIKKIRNNTKEKGLTIIVKRMYINERGIAKLEIAIAKGKKTYDKREGIKEREAKRDIDRESKM